jgi:hypothetical protein
MYNEWFNFIKLRLIDVNLAYSLSYGFTKIAKQYIDEEGCGAVFASLEFDK